MTSFKYVLCTKEVRKEDLDLEEVGLELEEVGLELEEGEGSSFVKDQQNLIKQNYLSTIPDSSIPPEVDAKVEVPSLIKNDGSALSLKVCKGTETQIKAILHWAKIENVELPSRILKGFAYLLKNSVDEFSLSLKKSEEALRLSITESKDEVIATLIKDNSRLYEEQLLLKGQLSTIEEEALAQNPDREARESRRLKRQMSKKVRTRDRVEESEFHSILSLIKLPGFVSARKKTALILLFFTGLRVSNLLLLTVKQVNALLISGETVISLIKGGSQRFPLILSPRGHKFLRAHSAELIKLMLDKSELDPFFTTQSCLTKSIDRTSFNKELNKVLTKASLEFGKHIRTHSFRATLITNYLDSTPIEQVQDLVGHRDIKTTAIYKRG